MMIRMFLACTLLGMQAAGGSPMDRAGHGAQSIVIAEQNRPPAIVELGEGRSPLIDTNWLRGYIAAVCGAQPSRARDLSSTSAQTAIVLTDPASAAGLGVSVPVRADTPEAYSIRTLRHGERTLVALVSRSPGGLRQAMLHLIREMKQDSHSILVRQISIDEAPWIPHRETMYLSCWGVPSDSRLDILSYDAKRLAAYTDMLMSFGYNGIQVFSGQSVYQRLSPNMEEGELKNEAFCRQVAGRAHLHAGYCTHWVWGGEIGAGDPEYDRAVDMWLQGKREGNEVDDPDIRRVFDRWYTQYARLADCVDRVIVHYGEPGGRLPWKSVASQLEMHKFLMDHYTAKNPSIIFGYNLWRSIGGYGYCSDEFLDLIRQRKYPPGHVFYEPGLPDEPLMPLGLWPWEDRAELRRALVGTGYQVGIWSDYLEDMESDGQAFMSVNDGIAKEFYSKVKQKLQPIDPTTCWSTMDASHITNIYSLYCAARLLWNPDYDTDGLLKEITDGIWGPSNGPKVLQALKVIRDTRSGPSWQTYWFGSGLRRVGTESAKDDLQRALAAAKGLEEMQIDPDFVPKFPLPFTPAVLAEVIVPNLKQIAMYAQNRITADEIVERSAKGAGRDELLALRQKISAIPAMGIWTGSWGPLENVATRNLMQKLADTDVALGPLWWDEDTGLTYVKLSMAGPWHAFDGVSGTAYNPGGYWSDETTQRVPTDLGYAWDQPQTITRMVLNYSTEPQSPADADGIRIQYWDGKWQTVIPSGVHAGPGAEGTWRCSYDISPITTRKLRVSFPKPMKDGSGISIAEMTVLNGDTKVDTPPYPLQ